MENNSSIRALGADEEPRSPKSSYRIVRLWWNRRKNGALGGLTLRLSDSDRRELQEEGGASLFEPVTGLPMNEYATLPKDWRNQPEKNRGWVARSVDYASKLPPKR